MYFDAPQEFKSRKCMLKLTGLWMLVFYFCLQKISAFVNIFIPNYTTIQKVLHSR